ncbi:Ig-like domain-containing protein [Thioclava litoralis]|uniref:Ig-like domain-containing protein n=1 Tax=Thioclava litoralis TaxID=3076557 RepID=A0ABZ1E340_9RHOB|nr:Ig-like domain-containing protein [Thioclava sp. FTW29]
MAKSVDFAVRDVTGGVSRGTVAGDGAGDFIQVGSGDAVSLNLRKTNILKYERAGGDLHVVLTDGRVVDLAGFFEAPANTLYISADGEITQVNLEDSGDGVLFANYSEPEIIGKWSPNDELAFLDGDDILAPVEEDTAGMAGFAPLLGLGPLLAGGAAAAGAVALASGGGDDEGDDKDKNTGGSDDGDDDAIIPTVNDPDADYTLTTNTDDPKAEVSGTGEPGSTVVVTLGDQTIETTVDENGDWAVTFEDDTFPSDGDMTSTVVVTSPGGTEYTLDGPDFLIDMTPPAVEVTYGAESTSDIENLAEYADGISIGGTGEAGASITVTINGQEQSTTVDTDGNWSVTFTQDQLPAGEYSTDMVVTATDVNGNVTVLNDVLVVDTELNVSFSSANVTADNVVSAAEASSGFTLSGTTDLDATSVSVSINGKIYDATVDASGNWSAVVTDSSLSSGSYVATVTAIDDAGNVSTATKSVTVDSSVSVGIDSTQMGDNVISGSETSGVILTGTAEALATVTVSFGSGTRTVVAGADGSWSANFSASEVPADSSAATISVSATDAYGNTASASQTIKVDTVLDTLTVSTSTPNDDLADNVVNATERAGGLVLSGTVEVGAQSVTVMLADGSQISATVNSATGTWSATVPADSLPEGAAATETLTVTAVDAYGNSGSTTLDVVFDTVVENFSVNSVTADNTVNSAEAASGFAISGTVEAGSTITVTITETGATQTVTVGADGTWTTTFGTDDLPAGTGTATYSITAVDAHGNTLEGDTATSGIFSYDLEAPEAPDVTWSTNGSSTVRALYTDSDGEADSYTVSAISGDGTVTELTHTATAANDGSGEDIYSFSSQAMSTYFAVTDVDAAGNESSTLTVSSETEVNLDLSRAGLDQFDFSKIDLDLADVNLTISGDQIQSLTGAENTLIIEGDSDDTVSVSGMTKSDTSDMDGYTLYTLDDGDAKLYVDDSITTSVI